MTQPPLPDDPTKHVTAADSVADFAAYEALHHKVLLPRLLPVAYPTDRAPLPQEIRENALKDALRGVLAQHSPTFGIGTWTTCAECCNQAWPPPDSGTAIWEGTAYPCATVRHILRAFGLAWTDQYGGSHVPPYDDEADDQTAVDFVANIHRVSDDMLATLAGVVDVEAELAQIKARHTLHACPECNDPGPHRIVDQPTGVVECRGCGIEINPSAAPQGGGPA